MPSFLRVKSSLIFLRSEMMVKILGVHGISGSGKDEFAKYADQLVGAKRISSGDVLKREVSTFFDDELIYYQHKHMHGSQEDKQALLRMPTTLAEEIGFIDAKECYIRNRHTIIFRCRAFMSWWCNEKRKISEDYFIMEALKNVIPGLNIVTDVRFPNEAAYIHKMGGLLVKVTRPGIESEDSIDHALDDWKAWDFTYENKASLETYHEWIGRVVNLYMGVMRE